MECWHLREGEEPCPLCLAKEQEPQAKSDETLEMGLLRLRLRAEANLTSEGK